MLEELHCRLTPPQKTMANNDEGCFRINGKGAQLVFANNNGKVQTPIDPKSGLPMLTLFHNVDDAAEKLEAAMHSQACSHQSTDCGPTNERTRRICLFTSPRLTNGLDFSEVARSQGRTVRCFHTHKTPAPFDSTVLHLEQPE